MVPVATTGWWAGTPCFPSVHKATASGSRMPIEMFDSTAKRFLCYSRILLKLNALGMSSGRGSLLRVSLAHKPCECTTRDFLLRNSSARLLLPLPGDQFGHFTHLIRQQLYEIVDRHDPDQGPLV